MAEQQMTKAELLKQIRDERQRLETTLAEVSERQMVQPDVHGGWSVKDLLAHVVAWERNMCAWVEESIAGKVPQMLPPGLTWDDIDQWNEQMYQEHKDQPLAEVQADFRASYQQSLALVEELPEGDLFAPDRFAWREGKPLWEMVAANTCWHYKEHDEEIRAWLDRT